jgi:hypothetical protein
MRIPQTLALAAASAFWGQAAIAQTSSAGNAGEDMTRCEALERIIYAEYGNDGTRGLSCVQRGHTAVLKKGSLVREVPLADQTFDRLLKFMSNPESGQTFGQVCYQQALRTREIGEHHTLERVSAPPACPSGSTARIVDGQRVCYERVETIRYEQPQQQACGSSCMVDTLLRVRAVRGQWKPSAPQTTNAEINQRQLRSKLLPNVNVGAGVQWHVGEAFSVNSSSESYAEGGSATGGNGYGGAGGNGGNSRPDAQPGTSPNPGNTGNRGDVEPGTSITFPAYDLPTRILTTSTGNASGRGPDRTPGTSN